MVLKVELSFLLDLGMAGREAKAVLALLSKQSGSSNPRPS